MKIPDTYIAENFSKPYEEPRFQIIDKETGAIIDDAQGYGYKSAANAYRALSYKLGRKERAQISIKVSEFIKSNKEILDSLKKDIKKCSDSVDDIMFYALKDNVKISEKKALAEAFSTFWKEFEQKGGTMPEDKSFRFRIEQKFSNKNRKS